MKMHARSRKPAKSAARQPRGRAAPAKKGRQVTIRNVPPHVDAALRKRARDEGKSLNAVMVEALSREFDAPEKRTFRDLSWLAGTWVEDPAFDEAIAAQDVVDEEMWQ